MEKIKVRKTRTKSGSTAVQVVYYPHREVEFVQQIGSAKREEEIAALVKRAEFWIENNEPSKNFSSLQNKWMLRILKFPGFIKAIHIKSYWILPGGVGSVVQLKNS